MYAVDCFEGRGERGRSHVVGYETEAVVSGVVRVAGMDDG